MACSEVAAILQTAGAHYISNIFQPLSLQQWCQFMLSIMADNLQFYSNFAPFSTLGGMKLNHYCFHLSISSEDQTTKRSSRKI